LLPPTSTRRGETCWGSGRNLRGARERLRTAAASEGAAEGAPGAAGWVDLDVLLDDLEDRLARIETLCAVAPAAILIRPVAAAVGSRRPCAVA